MIEENNVVCAKLLALPLPTPFEKSQRTEFLRKTFWGRVDAFCGFMGHMTVELENNKKIKKAEAVDIMSDIASAALSIGREDGWTDALKNYGEPCFQFLLNLHKETAA